MPATTGACTYGGSDQLHGGEGRNVDSQDLGGFLRSRRRVLQPEDVGLPRRARRRTEGLRREDVAELSGMSHDYYARLERGSGPQPSEQMVASLARGLRLSLAERDHLFALAGHRAPRHVSCSDHVSPGLMRILDQLTDTAAQVMSGTGQTLVQTALARALLGEQTQHTGPARSAVYRWFTDPSSRSIHPPEDHPRHGRIYTAQLRRTATAHGPGSPAADLAAHLRACSAEFTAYWSDHEIGLAHTECKRFTHAQVGELDLHCQSLLDPDQDQALLVFTATPGTDSHQRLQLLAVLGTQRLEPTATSSPAQTEPCPSIAACPQTNVHVTPLRTNVPAGRRCSEWRVRAYVTLTPVRDTVGPVKIGYGRVSTRDQHPEAQWDALGDVGDGDRGTPYPAAPAAPDEQPGKREDRPGERDDPAVDENVGARVYVGAAATE